MPSPAPSTAPTIAAPAPNGTLRADPFPVRARHIYMIGIGGCGMAGLARMLSRRGGIVSGSDLSHSETTDALQSEGIRVGFDQSRSWLPGPEEGGAGGCDLVVASAAIKPDHPQMLEANRRGIPTLMYAEALGKCMLGRTGIAVAGTHGKSTTTAMLGAALTDAGLDPTVIVGATCAQLERGCLGKYADFAESNAEIAEIPKSVRTHTPSLLSASSASPSAPSAYSPSSGFRLGSDSIPSGPLSGRPGILIAEACEFNRSFHNYRPLLASISSVEADHLDVYGTLDAVVEAFHEFAKLIAPAEDGGTLLIAHDGAHRREVTAGLKCNVETIGFSPEADWVVDYDMPTRRVSLAHRGTQIAAWTMTLPGVHNGLNAATALALATLAGADAKRIAASLSAFRGVDRRMQFLGEKALPGGGGHVRVFDDYGHHPTEVATTLKAFRDFERPQDRAPKGAPQGRLICVFQPHQHSRTRHLLEEFATAFGEADIVIVPHIYFVRDSIEEKHKVTAADLVDRLRQRGQRAMHLYPFEAIVEQLENLCRDGDVLVCMGAGPVYEIARAYLNNEPRA